VTVYVDAPSRYQFPDGTLHFARQTDQGYLTRSELQISPSGSPDTDPMALAASGSDYEDVVDQDQEVRVPVEHCPAPSVEPIGCCPACNTSDHRTRLDLFLIVAAFGWAVRARRRRRA
jgi:hypothetical protein